MMPFPAFALALQAAARKQVQMIEAARLAQADTDHYVLHVTHLQRLADGR